MSVEPGPAPDDRIRRIRDIHADARDRGRPVVSFELFPPKTSRGEERLFERTLPELVSARPDFVSVTYGAGGSTHGRTLDVVDHIQRQHDVTGLAHLTCIGSTRAQIRSYLEDAARRNIRNVLALRGDPPRDNPDVTRPADGFDYSVQLIDFIREVGDFSVGAAGFPESRTALTDGKHVDWQRLKDKIEHGAEFILTQLFFDNARYFEFRDYMVDRLGVTTPLTPGILPILGTEQVKRFSAVCGATLPSDLVSRLDALGDDEDAVRAFGVEYATRQCEELLAGGAPGIHFYALNRSGACLAILQDLGLRPTSAGSGTGIPST